MKNPIPTEQVYFHLFWMISASLLLALILLIWAVFRIIALNKKMRAAASVRSDDVHELLEDGVEI